MRARSCPFVLLLFLILCLTPRLSRADESLAGAAFKQATALVADAKWAEALAAFERAAAAHRHAITTFNIAQCERAMGRYARARRSFAQALLDNEVAGGRELQANLIAETTERVDELDRILVRLTLTIDPSEAKIAVDGRPLERGGNADPPNSLVAGVRPPGPGEPLPQSAKAGRVVVMDPGVHVFTFSRDGFADVVLNRTFAPGAAAELGLRLELLPATLKIEASRPRAVVSVDGLDVGPAPVDVSRPAGTHVVLVRADGFVPYRGELTVKPGQSSRLMADLRPETPSLFGRWWFWTAAAVVLAGAATTTYLVSRPEPQREPVSGGSLGWTLAVP